MKKIVIFTVDHLEFSSRVMEPLLHKYGSQIKRIYVSKTHFDFHFLKLRYKFFIKNHYPFCIRMGDIVRFLKWKWMLRSNEYGHRNMIEYLTSCGFEAEYVSNVNSTKVLGNLKALDADLFLFCLFDQIAKDDLLSIPNIGTYNLHMGKLPEYRGGLSSFWVLSLGDMEAGVSLHKVTEVIDGGDIVAEIRFPVDTNSMYELMSTSIDNAGKMLVEGVTRIMNGTATPIDKTGRNEGYFFIPGKDDFRAFYNKGCRLI